MGPIKDLWGFRNKILKQELLFFLIFSQINQKMIKVFFILISLTSKYPDFLTHLWLKDTMMIKMKTRTIPVGLASPPTHPIPSFVSQR